LLPSANWLDTEGKKLRNVSKGAVQKVRAAPEGKVSEAQILADVDKKGYRLG
jgi:hypothetical protein